MTDAGDLSATPGAGPRRFREVMAWTPPGEGQAEARATA